MYQEVWPAPSAAKHGPWSFPLTIRLLCAVAGLLSLLSLLGWFFHRPLLVSLLYGSVTMKPNTAVLILLLTASTLLRQAGGSFTKAANFLNLCALALAAASLLEYVSGRDFGIDQLLAHVPMEAAGDPPGRMSRGTAIDGLLSALALLSLDAPPFGTLFAALGGLLSLSALVGYLFGAGPLFGVRLLRSMAPRTALAFFLLQIVFFLLRPQREPTYSLLRSARFHRFGSWYVAATCLLPLLLGLPIASMYHRGQMEASFAFAVLVVLLIAAQAVLLSRNSRSLALVEDARNLVEGERLALAAQNQRQLVDLVASEARAAQSEAQYRLITNALPSLVSYIGPDFRYVRLNRTYEDWFGHPSTELEGKSVDEVLGRSADSVRRHLEAALRGEPQQFETQITTRKGERTVNISHIPDIDEAGRVRGVVVQSTDITERKHAEAALRQTEKLAAVGKLASSIAHEINNPLESVTNLLYLASTSTSTEEIKFYLETAEEEIARVSAIANQTLRFHRQASAPVKITANELLETVMAIYKGRLKGSVRVQQQHRPSDPICCMEGEIRQVLNNLVGNALDAMTGGAPGRLLLRSRNGTDWRTGRPGLVLIVADTGSGMSPATQASLFEAFFTTKGASGTGLGLWVSKEIVDRHLGRLNLRSSQNPAHHGTVFRLFLPRDTGRLAS